MMRVLDLSTGPAGRFTTLLLAEAGADVITIDPPATAAPATDASDEAAFQSAFLNRRKRSVALDITTRRGRELLLKLAATAQAVVEDRPPGDLARLRLAFRSLRRANPAVVLTSISPFGQDGPRADWQGAEIVLQAMGGIMDSTGAHGGPPLMIAGTPAHYIAGLNAATATVAAVRAVRAGRERAVHLDIAIQETVTPHLVRHLEQYIYTGALPLRGGNSQVNLGYPEIVRARDGYLFPLALRAEWESFAFFWGLEQFVTHEWSDRSVRDARWQEIDPHFHAAVATRDREEWMARGVEHGYTFAPIQTADEVLASPHLAARGFFSDATLNGDTAPCAGLPFSFDPGDLPANRPPQPGEHTDAILSADLGLTPDDVAALRRAAVI